MLKRFARLITHPSQAAMALQRRLRHASLSKSLLLNLFEGRDKYEHFKDELRNSGLEEQLKEKIRSIGNLQGATSGGKAYDLGAMSTDEAANLYAIVRKRQPQVIRSPA